MQQRLLDEVIGVKLQNRKLAQEGLPTIEQRHHFILCQHPHVYTLGRNGKQNHLLLSEAQLHSIGATFVPINRGGDITYHGPGQIVGYPIFDLDEFFTDIGKYIRYLEEAVILTMAEYGIKGGRVDGQSGVWIDPERPIARKICAIGVHLSRWVTMHGFALNVNTDLTYFQNIIPCGIQDKGVTSMSKELKMELDIKEVEDRLVKHFKGLFDFEAV